MAILNTWLPHCHNHSEERVLETSPLLLLVETKPGAEEKESQCDHPFIGADRAKRCKKNIRFP